MASYIGRTPTIGNFQKCDAISVVNGQATYGLTVNSVAVYPESANHVLCSLNGILQAPQDSFTISSSNIVFASNLSTGDVIDFVMILGNVLDLGVPSDNTVSTAKLVDSAVTSAKLGTDVTQGILEADQYRLTADITSNTDPISSNLERVDDASFSKIGTGISVSSGIFSFPRTGLYQVYFTLRSQQSSSDTITGVTYVTTDNGSNYDSVAESANGDNGSTRVNIGTSIAFVNVTNISNVKVKFAIESLSSGTVEGSTDTNKTSFTFIRLGDSQ